MREIRLVIADDNEGIRETLRFRLSREPDIRILDVVADGQAALNAIRAAKVDVLLLDQSMPGLLGSEVAFQLYLEGSITRIVLLSAERDIDTLELPPTVVRRIAKDEPHEVVLAALREASRFVILQPPR